MCTVELQNVSRGFSGRKVLAGVSFLLNEGESAAVIGNNGAGKSTLLRLIAGAGKPDSGRILVGGMKPREAIQRARRGGENRISALLPEAHFYDDLTLDENISLWMRGLRGSVEVRDDLLNRLDLRRFRATLLRDASQGVRQKAALLRSFLGCPSLLLLDEPFSHLDEAARTVLLELFQEAGRRGATILCAGHGEIELPFRRRLLVAEGRVTIEC